MEQDLFSWLNSQRKSQEAGLLVAPLSPETKGSIQASEERTAPQDSDSQNQTAGSIPGNEILAGHVDFETHGDEPVPSESEHEDAAAYVEDDTAGVSQLSQTYSENEELTGYVQLDSDGNFQLIQSDLGHEDITSYIGNDSAGNSQPSQTDSGHEDTTAYTEDDSAGDSQLSQIESEHEVPTAYLEDDTARDSQITQTDSQTAQEYPNHDDDPVSQNHEWQERATGFTLSLDEPPPELWTRINDDDPDPEYEPTDSLQGAAYVKIHGRNFTERLHHTLKHRKERAEERAQSESEPDPSSPLKQMAVILCACLVMALGFGFLALWFVGRETPEGMMRRAEALNEAGKFDEASEIYRIAHRRYPDKPEFLAKLSESSEKAGHPQTAKTAHDEYQKKISAPESTDNTPKAEAKPEITPETAARRVVPEERPLTFTDYLNEGNHAYNIGMYNRAVINFFRAMEIDRRDIRPYLGLSASYRMKGMYFDSYRILEEARRLFGRSPAVDMGIYFLREAK